MPEGRKITRLYRAAQPAGKRDQDRFQRIVPDLVPDRSQGAAIVPRITGCDVGAGSGQ